LTTVSNDYASHSSKPKAYLNWVLFDEQFHYVTGTGTTNSGFQQVGTDTTFTTHTITGQIITRSGWLFVYVSNETPNINVYFDNLQLTHIRGRIIEETHYYPFGLSMSGISYQEAGKPENKYRYNGKELQHKEFNDGSGLENYDYYARFCDVQLGRWSTMDPKSEKYQSLSPYVYTANNPLYYVDPNGMVIDPFSMTQWDQEKQNVINEKTKLLDQIESITNKGSLYGWDDDKLADELGDLNDRVSSLNSTLDNLGLLETSAQVYALGAAENGVGGTIYDPSSGKIIFKIGSTANFIHETTHGGQFERGEIAFNKVTGNALAEDLYDEIASYRAQYAYDPSSVSGLPSNSIAHTSDDITPAWVQNLTGANGAKPYAPGGRAHTGITSLNINSNKQDYLNAYPTEADYLRNVLPDNFSIRTFPGTYFKQ
jgi:RHS repeat-associated protein